MQLNIQMFGGRGARSNRQVKKTDEHNEPLYEHEEEKRKFDERTVINNKVIALEEYENKFKLEDLRKNDCKKIADRSREVLNSRNKSEYEDIFAYNIDTGEIINGKEPIKPREAISSKEMDALANKNINYVIVHNHPNNTMPSDVDLTLLLQKWNNSKCCYVICHNGDVWKYRIDKNAVKEFDTKTNLIYTEDDIRDCYLNAKVNGTDFETELSKKIKANYGIIVERL